MLGDTCTQNLILAQGVCLRSPKLHMFKPRMSKTPLLFVLLHLGGYPSLLCTKPEEQSCSAEAMKSQTALFWFNTICHEVLFSFLYLQYWRGRRQKCVFLVALLLQILHAMSCQDLLVSCTLTFSQPTVNRKTPRIILFTSRCGTHIDHNWMAAS